MTQQETLPNPTQDTLVQEEVQFLEPGDHERFSHYVRKEKIVESAVLGTP